MALQKVLIHSYFRKRCHLLACDTQCSMSVTREQDKLAVAEELRPYKDQKDFEMCGHTYEPMFTVKEGQI